MYTVVEKNPPKKIPIRKRKRGPKAPNRAQRAPQPYVGVRREGGRRAPKQSPRTDS